MKKFVYASVLTSILLATTSSYADQPLGRDGARTVDLINNHHITNTFTTTGNVDKCPCKKHNQIPNKE